MCLSAHSLDLDLAHQGENSLGQAVFPRIPLHGSRASASSINVRWAEPDWLSSVIRHVRSTGSRGALERKTASSSWSVFFIDYSRTPGCPRVHKHFQNFGDNVYYDQTIHVLQKKKKLHHNKLIFYSIFHGPFEVPAIILCSPLCLCITALRVPFSESLCVCLCSLTPAYSLGNSPRAHPRKGWMPLIHAGISHMTLTRGPYGFLFPRLTSPINRSSFGTKIKSYSFYVLSAWQSSAYKMFDE